MSFFLLAWVLMVQSPATQIESLYEQARQAERQSDFASAAGFYEEILKLDATLDPIRVNLGIMYYLNGDFLQARG